MLAEAVVHQDEPDSARGQRGQSRRDIGGDDDTEPGPFQAAPLQHRRAWIVLHDEDHGPYLSRPYGVCADGVSPGMRAVDQELRQPLNGVREGGVVERLDDADRRSQRVAAIDLRRIVGGREDDHRDARELRVALEPPQDLESSKARHVEVEQQHQSVVSRSGRSIRRAGTCSRAASCPSRTWTGSELSPPRFRFLRTSVAWPSSSSAITTLRVSAIDRLSVRGNV